MAQTYGTIWVCIDCAMHQANGECDSCHDSHGHDREPLGAVAAQHRATAGMLHEEHAETCEVRILGHWPSDYECDCATNPFSRSRCEGCGSWLHGERHALTLLGD